METKEIKITVRKSGDAWAATSEFSESVGIGQDAPTAIENFAFCLRSILSGQDMHAVKSGNIPNE